MYITVVENNSGAFRTLYLRVAIQTKKTRMPEININIEKLRKQIGLRVWHLGQECRVVELLEDEPALVLVASDTDSIQADQFGNAHRKVPMSYIVQVLTHDKQEYHPDYQALDWLD